MKMSDFDYNLPPELIAQEPSSERELSRLLTLDRKEKKWEHQRCFSEITRFLQAGDVLVLNDTKVVNARLIGVKETGGKVDALVVKKQGDRALAMIQTARLPKSGDVYHFGQYKARVVERKEDGWELDFAGVLVENVMRETGYPPLPPYIKRKGEERERMSENDRQRYQTVYALNPGSIAAPTAGLHFTQHLLDELRKKGVELLYVTLHVGPGTFLPVKSEEAEKHQMSYEYYQISEETAICINKAKKEKRRVIATGTTSCRTLESAGKSGVIEPGEGNTNLFIYPGFEYKIVQSLITNFHLPKSTLILLVAAFAGSELILKVYEDAIAQKYRFYSYGDAMFIF